MFFLLHCTNDRDHATAVRDPSISKRTQAAARVHPLVMAYVQPYGTARSIKSPRIISIQPM